jgi:hypothetical protein
VLVGRRLALPGWPVEQRDMSGRSREGALEPPAEKRGYDEKPSICRCCVDCDLCVGKFQSGRSRHFFAGHSFLCRRRRRICGPAVCGPAQGHSIGENAAKLTLSDNEAAKFWPVYDQYSTELQDQRHQDRYYQGVWRRVRLAHRRADRPAADFGRTLERAMVQVDAAFPEELRLPNPPAVWF